MATCQPLNTVWSGYYRQRAVCCLRMLEQNNSIWNKQQRIGSQLLELGYDLKRSKYACLAFEFDKGLSILASDLNVKITLVFISKVCRCNRLGDGRHSILILMLKTSLSFSYSFMLQVWTEFALSFPFKTAIILCRILIGERYAWWWPPYKTPCSWWKR